MSRPSTDEYVKDPFEWLNLLCPIKSKENQTVRMVPGVNKEPLTGLPYFRPFCLKLPKEEKRKKLAQRIDDEQLMSSALLKSNDANSSEFIGPRVPSPNMFIANALKPGEVDVWRAKEAVDKLLVESAYRDKVQVDAIMIPSKPLRFFNVSIRCKNGKASDRSIPTFSFGNSSGCSFCLSLKNESQNDENAFCYAQLAVLELFGRHNLKFLRKYQIRVTPSASFLDGGSALTNLITQLITSNGAKVCDSNTVGSPIKRSNDNLTKSHVPEDVDDTKDVLLPDKLTYVPSYVTEEEEAELMKTLSSALEKNALKRRVAHYGYAFDYHIQQIDPKVKIPIPPVIQELAERLYADGLVPEQPDQITVNEYQPGQGIGFHTDVHATFTSWIASLSLGSTSVMEFRKLEPIGDHIQPTKSTLQDEGHLPSNVPTFFEKPNVIKRKLCELQSRSITIFSDELRYAWQHSIASRKSDRLHGETAARKTRLSITFRKVRDPRLTECPCEFDYHCDQKNPETYLNLLPTRLSGKATDGAAEIKQLLHSK